jgi:hypothetical protein
MCDVAFQALRVTKNIFRMGPAVVIAISVVFYRPSTVTKGIVRAIGRPPVRVRDRPCRVRAAAIFDSNYVADTDRIDHRKRNDGPTVAGSSPYTFTLDGDCLAS